ncbi:hypothetical protein CDL15_Pgr026170 [Punica granatum]|uniref:Uncharacterized protein n=1 Tax=Punica granatum TaxID=22663 RepID=A0A218WWN6_PUNGR|nr:hypothetical protein CDL15_Pgr026170 [Punica granatum]
MPTLHSATQSKAQCGIVRLNYTTHLDLLSSALKVSDAFFKSLEVQSRQAEITVISRVPKQLRKQSEKFSFGLLGRLQLHICITGLRVNCSRSLTIHVKMTNVGCKYKICCQKRLILLWSPKTSKTGFRALYEPETFFHEKC